MDNQSLRNITGANTVWVGNNPYLVTSSGVIPLTSGFSALSLGQPQQISPVSPTNQGQYYVVSVQESPTKTSPPVLDNPRTGLGLYNSGNLTASTPNLGFSAANNNYTNLQFSPQQVNLPYSPGFINGFQGQQFPPTFTNGYSTLQYPQKTNNELYLQTHGTNTLNQQYIHNSNRKLSNISLNGNSNPAPMVSPSLSSSSMSVMSDGALPSPEMGLNCVYSTNTDSNRSNSTTPLALSRPATLPKPKRASVGEVFGSNGNDSKKIYLPVPPCYDRPINKECCLRCGKKVYHMEKLGPVKDCMYHKLCFSCVVCNTILNLKNYHLNPNEMEDINAYCVTHMPSNKTISIDAGAIGIQTAMHVQRKTSEGNDGARYKGHTYNLDVESLNMQHVRNIPVQNLQASNKTRESSWTRHERHSESVPPPGVIRYDEPLPEYDHMTTRFYNSP